MSPGLTSPMGFCSEGGPSISLRPTAFGGGDQNGSEFAVFRPLRRFRDLLL